MISKSRLTGLGIALGAAMGAALGVAAGHMAVWLAVGVAIGMALGATAAPETGKSMCEEMHSSTVRRSGEMRCESCERGGASARASNAVASLQRSKILRD